MLEKEEGVKQTLESPAEVAEVIPQDVKPEEPAEVIEETPAKPATPPKGYVPIQALDEERRHIKLLEEELQKTKSSVSPEQLAEVPDWDLMTDNEKWIAKEVIQLKDKTKWEEDMTRARKAFPALGNKEAEFKEYCYKFPKSVDVEVLARSFLFEPVKEEPVQEIEPKKGLERPTGGSRQAPSSEISLEEIQRIRENQPKVYEKMIRDGKFPKKLPEK